MKESKIAATERLRREGRWEEASAFRDEERSRLRAAGRPKTEANERAWEAMLAKFAPLPAREEKAAPDQDDAEIDALAAQFHGVRPDLVRDTLWTYDNLDNRRTTAADAPSLGAWSLLKWARDNRDRFFEQMLPKAMAVQPSPAAADGYIEDDGIEDIKRMLAEYGVQTPAAAGTPRDKLQTIIADRLADLERQGQSMLSADVRTNWVARTVDSLDNAISGWQSGVTAV